MRKRLIAGNWKMHATIAAATALAAAVRREVGEDDSPVEVVLAPPFTALAAVASVVAGGAIRCAAQNMHWADAGAYTGEISPPMVAELADYVILGHSERRQHFGEGDGDVNRKVRAALAHGLGPIVCIGETAAERQAGQTDDVIERQLAAGLAGLSAGEVGRLVMAYEPVWAIGTGASCEPGEASRVAARIRAWLGAAAGAAEAQASRILYGGSVSAANFGSYLAAADLDGALVGGASLEATSFAAIVRIARQAPDA